MVLGPDVAASGNDAVIRWTTDVECGTRVQFGTTPTGLDRRTTGAVGTQHEVTLTGLRPGTVYHFTVGTARVPLATNSFSTLALSVPDRPAAAAPPSFPPPAAAPKPPTLPQQQPRPPPARVTWGSFRTLADHFDRHGPDFNARSAEDYAAQAWLFLVRAKSEGLPAKRDPDGVMRVYDPRSGAFAAYNRDGTTKTYFKPGRPDYFEDQPGKPVDLRTLDDFQPPQ